MSPAAILNGNGNGNGNGNATAHSHSHANADDTAPPVRGCWATLMTGDAYLPGLAVFAHSLLRGPHASAFPLIVMIAADSCSAGAIQTVLELGCRVVQVQRLGLPAGNPQSSLAERRFSEVWTKLRAWELDEFQRVVLVDSDMLVVKNMDELFHIELPPGGPLGMGGIAATFACTCNPEKIKTYPSNWIPQNCAFTPQTHPSCLSDPFPPLSEDSPSTYRLLNSGLVVLSPSSSVFQCMVEEIATSAQVGSYRFPDQDFLADFFSGCFLPLPYVYNALKKLRLVHPRMWRDGEVKNVHYILKKPWDTRDIGGPDQVTHAWWWDAWQRTDLERAGGVSEGNWERCVQRYVTALDS